MAFQAGRHFIWHWRLGHIAFHCALFVALIAVALYNGGSVSKVRLFIFIMGAHLAGLLVFFWRKHHRNREVKNNHYEVCMNCGYLLHGINSDRCPECGLPFDRMTLEDEWKTYVP